MRYPKKGIEHLLSVAEEASKRAGAALSGMGASGLKVTADAGRDIKIAADRQAESVIIRFLQREAPFSILTEERGIIGKRLNRLRWIVDPLDGTLNYSRRIPLSCVSIGLWDGDTPVLGVVNDFNRAELFSGMAPGGAWLNGRKIKVSAVSRKEKAVFLTGFPSRTDFSVKAISGFVNSVRSYKKVRLLGSAALSLAYVAAGRADEYYEKDIMLWDVAGGVPIVLGAGGMCRTIVSAGKRTVIEYAGNAALYRKCMGIFL